MGEKKKEKKDKEKKKEEKEKATVRSAPDGSDKKKKNYRDIGQIYKNFTTVVEKYRECTD